MMASATHFLAAVADRRSVYALSKEIPVSNERILELVTEALKHAPSPFNVRSTQESTPAAIGILRPKIKGFVAAKGTAHAKLYPEWEEHSSSMNQLIAWTALSAESVGANLQHYQPGITPYLQEKYGVDKSWRLKAQMVFGV
ncbi:hypothetical protein PMIN03_006787 [Paraphaeosphaeria minitans]|uniref:Nitroreductase family protein n=1 Tax=Paraphaeosphaeria minitans TaxID=565426 RepID=A0A9P6GRH6_9PLEO|nr:nitroreductase family protein [Paraphaeosphaeria minitans]